MRLIYSDYVEAEFVFARDQVFGWFRDNLTIQVYLTSDLIPLLRIDKEEI